MKVKDYNYNTFPEYNEEVEGIIELNGRKENLRCRLLDVQYQENCIIRFLFPNTILDENRKYPLIIHIQGSGWYKQDMNDHIFDFMPIVKQGYAYAIVQYHSAPEHHFPQQIYDVKNAIRYLQNHYQHYPIDLDHVILSGDSSGGHIGLLTLFTYDSHEFDNDDKPLIKLDGMIDLYGVTHFLTINEWWSKYDMYEEKNIVDLMGKDHMNETYLKQSSPIYYLKENMNLPPILILHGNKDHVVPFTQSLELYHKLKQYHYDVTFGRVKDADHGRSIFYVKDVYDCMINFLNRVTNNNL